ncbi:MAG: energy-coupling factor transporter transmembrane protein EcfT [Firmicutes bacterium]|nr:energy-coupling factor transporter transmembrane protein EcfT [Bacillota bacterium]
MTRIKLGQYVYGDSLIHSLDPRTKIICCTFAVIAVLTSHSLYYLLFFLVLMAAAIKGSGIPPDSILRSLRSIRYLLLITFVFQAVLTAGEPAFRIGSLSVTREGLTLGTVNLFRLVILYLGSIILLMTTSPLKFAAGLEYLLSPLNRIRVPVHNFTTVVNISFRFIPTLVEEVNIIKDAQSSRGAPFDSPRLLVRLKSYLAILIPLLASSLLRAEDLAEAMDSRCYAGHRNRYRMNSLKLQGRDAALMGFMAAVLLLGLIISYA